MSRLALRSFRLDRAAVKAMILVSVLLLLPLGAGRAQATLRTGPLSVWWPTVRIPVAAECDSTPVWVTDPLRYHIVDNGTEVQNFTLFCNDPPMRAAMSVSLVFDASGSMAGTSRNTAIMAGHAFVDSMDGINDEAAVIFFNQVSTIYQQMTTIKPMLHSAIDALPASSPTALWDGIFAGVIELINNGVNQQRAVIVITDGTDVASSRTMTEVIALALRHHIRIYTVGVGDQFNPQELEEVATRTYGRFYQGPRSAIVNAYQEIYSIITRMNFGECFIEYDIPGPPCAGGGVHDVDIELQGVCGVTGSVHTRYDVPLDSTTWTKVKIGFDDMFVKSGKEYTLPLKLRTALPRTVLPPLSFHLEFGPGCASSGFGSPGIPGEFYYGKPITVTPEGNGVRIALTDTFTVEGSGTILDMLVNAPVTSADTVCCDVTLSDARFEGSCYIPVTDDGLICIVKELPQVEYTLGSSAVMNWYPAINDYVPNPLLLKSAVTNIGDADAKNLHYLMEYDTTAFVLTSHASNTVHGNPTDLAPGTRQEVDWKLRVLPRSKGDTMHICVTVMFDNYQTLRLCHDLYVPAAGVPALDVECPGPLTLVYDPQADAWIPNPFWTGVRVKNTGTAPATNVRATIALPAGLSLEPGEQVVRVVSASPLLPWTPGDSVPLVRWTMRLLRTPPVCRDTTVLVSFTVTGTQEDGTPLPPVSCSLPVLIRAPIQPAHPPIAVFGSLAFCEGDSVMLDAGAGFQGYLWSNGLASRSIVVRQSGSYFCMLTGLAGCPFTSDTVSITVHPLPAKPAITRHLDQLTATDADTWQWYRDGMEIPGATSRDLAASQTGSYRVRVTNSFGCEAWSDPFDVTVLDVADAAAVVDRFELFPNPAGGVVTVRFVLALPGQPTVSVHDLLGRELLRRTSEMSAREGELRLDLSAFPAGLYHVRLLAGSTIISRQLLLSGTVH
ncbi:MAG: VWA domain-containing protein [Bacteroidetes bacterium]|nr:VWA domain-containing protein [Bacteroidota bacterium]